MRTQPHSDEAIMTSTHGEIAGIVPTLTVDDLQKSITFYEALGFAVDEKWEHDGKLLGVMMRAGTAEIGLNQDDWKKGRDRKKGMGVRVSFKTSVLHVDQMPNGAKNAGFRSSLNHTTPNGRA